MAVRAKRRFTRLVIALLFALSSVGHVYAATEALAKMPAASMENSMPDHGMDCGGGSDKATKTACVAMCATAVAILDEPIAMIFAVAALDIDSDPELPPLSLGPSPEPPPPKR